MHDGTGAIDLENRIKSFSVTDISHLQRPPLDRIPVTIGKVIVGYRDITSPGEGFASVAADVTGSARDENCVVFFAIVHGGW